MFFFFILSFIPARVPSLRQYFQMEMVEFSMRKKKPFNIGLLSIVDIGPLHEFIFHLLRCYLYCHIMIILFQNCHSIIIVIIGYWVSALNIFIFNFNTATEISRRCLQAIRVSSLNQISTFLSEHIITLIKCFSKEKKPKKKQKKNPTNLDYAN